MSYSVANIMERVGSNQPGLVIEFLKDAFKELGMRDSLESKVKKYDVYTNRLKYTLPSGIVRVTRVSVLYEINASEQISEETDRTLTGGSTNWTDTDCATFDDTTDLSLTADTADQSCYLDQTDIIALGGRYKLEYDSVITSGTWKLYTKTDNTVLGVFEDGENNFIEFAAPAEDELKIVCTSASGQIDLDNFSLKDMSRDKYKTAGRIQGDLGADLFDEEM